MNNIYSQMEKRLSYSLPKWLVFFVFLKNGLYRGRGWRIKWKRIMCWNNRHNFFKIDFPTNVRFDCRDCGEQITIQKENGNTTSKI